MMQSIINFFVSSRDSQRNQGFTLMELLIVTMIVGLLAAISYPQIISQAGKAREVELKNMTGTINRSQQAYHWERTTFAKGNTNLETLEILGIKPLERYIDDYNFQVDNTSAVVALVNNDFVKDQTRAYAGGVFLDANQNYVVLMCQSVEIKDKIVDLPTLDDGCKNSHNIK